MESDVRPSSGVVRMPLRLKMEVGRRGVADGVGVKFHVRRRDVTRSLLRLQATSRGEGADYIVYLIQY